MVRETQAGLLLKNEQQGYFRFGYAAITSKDRK